MGKLFNYSSHHSLHHARHMGMKDGISFCGQPPESRPNPPKCLAKIMGPMGSSWVILVPTCFFRGLVIPWSGLVEAEGDRDGLGGRRELEFAEQDLPRGGEDRLLGRFFLFGFRTQNPSNVSEK